MPKLQPLTWNQFSERHPTHLSRADKKDPIPAKKLHLAMVEYRKTHPAFNLSDQGAKTLKKYAFHKAGFKYHKKAHLTEAQASQVFHHYHHALATLRGELNTEFQLVKPLKPKVPKELARLAIVSATVLEKYLEPTLKDNAQKLLNQVHSINQKVTPIFKKDPYLNPHKIFTLELLAKHIAYLNPKNKDKIQIPHEGRLVEYEAEEIHLWMGMYTYGFKPVDPKENAPPILAFSGTRLAMSTRGSLATVTADFDPRGVGYIAYSYGKEVIAAWLKNASRNGNAIITGHSLGGALARYTAIDNPDLVHGAYTFSAPDIGDAHGKKLIKLVKESKKDPSKRCPALYNFSHCEDKVPTLGHRSVGKNYQVICTTEKTINQKFSAQRSIHCKRLFGRDVALLCKTNPKKSLSVSMQKAICIIPFIFLMTMLFLSRILFGIHTSRPYVSVFGPLRWTWRKLVTDHYAAKYLPKAAAAAA